MADTREELILRALKDKSALFTSWDVLTAAFVKERASEYG